eukprot:TRINITY_DN1434_c0_g1_i3.p1 TRINITY_DN1434_c0_g1~~TRINITY_DN1434_c0_g1_i3.p1  ORF type:complete len:178 (-),score=58.84 TRINITY_DN1434_c0_g1_i3:101-634(-)
MEKGNQEGARIYAETAIRCKNQSVNYLRLSSRVDAVAARLDAAIKMNKITKSMGNITKIMDKAMESMDLQQISAVLDKFETQFEDLDVQSQYVSNAMGDSMALSTPDDEVDALIGQVADEYNIELDGKLDIDIGGDDLVAESSSTTTTTVSEESSKTSSGKSKEEEDLLARLEQLKS